MPCSMFAGERAFFLGVRPEVGNVVPTMDWPGIMAVEVFPHAAGICPADIGHPILPRWVNAHDEIVLGQPATLVAGLVDPQAEGEFLEPETVAGILVCSRSARGFLSSQCKLRRLVSFWTRCSHNSPAE